MKEHLITEFNWKNQILNVVLLLPHVLDMQSESFVESGMWSLRGGSAADPLLIFHTSLTCWVSLAWAADLILHLLEQKVLVSVFVSVSLHYLKQTNSLRHKFLWNLNWLVIPVTWDVSRITLTWKVWKLFSSSCDTKCRDKRGSLTVTSSAEPKPNIYILPSYRYSTHI